MINFNGNTCESNNCISVQNRGFLFGDAVFDVLKVVGKKIYFWEEHYLRLMASMRIVRMEIPHNFTMEFLENQIIKTICENNQENQAVCVRFTVVRSQSSNYTPKSNSIDYYIKTQAIDAVFYQNQEIPYEVELYKDFYVQPDLLSTLKTANRMINITGSVFAQENDYQNCILLNSQKNVASFLDGNLFIINENHIKTPPTTDGCINGVTRKKIIEIIKKTNDFTIEEASISPFDLQKSDELFLTNSIVGIQSVSQYRKKTFNNTIAKNLIGKLNTAARLG